MMKIDELMGNFASTKISDTFDETPRCKTLRIGTRHTTEYRPGQFLMVWIPGIDEVPMSLSKWSPESVEITVLNVGEATEALLSMNPGDWIGIRGPFGRPFETGCKRALVVGGGVGMAPLRPLVYSLLKARANVTLLIAAKTKDELVFYREFSELHHKNFRLLVTTDDGSEGFRGQATRGVAELLNINEFEILYTCGPEMMIAELYRMANRAGINFQASLERFMKCGCGICGTCAMDPTGDLVCMDGPVFDGKQLEQLSDFGRYRRDQVGFKNKI
jgi:dihydroorotate dehydrogenase electron transfer subunit